MCGIVGIVDRSGHPVEEALIVRMRDQLIHRGPDESGMVCFPRQGEGRRARMSAALGSRRLSIIDVRHGHQPIANEDGTIWTVLNGEIYNFRELREGLKRAGHGFVTESDTEVIVHLYEEQGDSFVAALDGMFALALWDDRAERLILARDRFGKKPLLYAEIGQRFLFASEFQAMLRDPAVSREIDPAALDEYLTYLAIPAPLSIYRAIRKVPPAHLLVHDRTGTRLRRYWSLAYQPKVSLSEPEAQERVRELLTAAVKKRLVSEVPLGAFLSGGVDSSIVVALMATLLGRGVKTFSIGFDEERYNELPHAQRVAEQFECEHHALMVTPRALEVLPKLVEHFGEPFADSSAIPAYYLAQLTRQHVTVALNGDGGDEAFAGYGRHLANRLVETWRQAPVTIRRPLAWMSYALVPPAVASWGWPGRLRRFMEASSLSRADRYQWWAGVFNADLKTTLLGRDGEPSAHHGLVDRLFGENEALDAVDAALAVDTAFYLPTDLLVKMDISSMANSLEVRSPFLDHHVMEFVASLPSHLKLRRLTSKHLLKRTFENVLPRDILHRRKSGFAVPIGRWFRSDLREMLCDHLLNSRLAQAGVIRQATATALVSGHLRGRFDGAHQLWTLLMLELWYRRFIEERDVPKG